MIPFLAADPLYADGIDGTVILIVIAKVLVTFALLLVLVMLIIWFERKVVSDMQNRVGPNQAGPWGLLISLADAIKLFFKEQSIPDAADRKAFFVAPYMSLLPAFLAFAVLPIGGEIHIAGKTTYLQLADLPMGVLWVLAMSGIGVYGVLLAGWGSGTKYPLLGGVRASAQVISYEATMGLAVVGAVLQSGSLSTREFVNAQGWNDGFASIGHWFFIAAFPAFILYVIAMIAETNRAPFDMVEAEQELVGGFHTEYTGIRFAIFFLSEYMNMITMSGIAVTLFLGGPSGPTFDFASWLWGPIWFLLKVTGFMFLYVWLRGTLPRLRYDQLMNLGWKWMLELALFWVMISATWLVAKEEGWNLAIIVPSSIAAAAVAMFLLLQAFPKTPASTESARPRGEVTR